MNMEIRARRNAGKIHDMHTNNESIIYQRLNEAQTLNDPYAIPPFMYAQII